MPKRKDLIHDWFGLTYASYLTLPRSILQSMPIKWQEDFVEILNQLEEECINRNVVTPDYTVSARENGKFIKDPFRDYERGRRNIFEEFRLKEEKE